MKNLHLKQKIKNEVVRRIKPTRNAAWWAQELFSILGDENPTMENAEWMPVDEVHGSFENLDEGSAITITLV